MLREIESGSFVSKRKKLQDFVAHRRLPAHYLTKKFSRPQIKGILEELTQIYDSEIGSNGTGRRWSLRELVFNPRSPYRMYSYFLYAAHWGLQELTRGDVDPNPEMTKPFLPLFSDLSKKDYQRLIEGVESIKEFFNNMPRDSYGRIVHRFPYGWNLCQWYADWLMRQDWLSRLNVGLISAKSRAWKKFVLDTEDDIGVPLQ
jgi:hypothetical protein